MVADRWKVDHRIGKGAFGVIHHGIDSVTGGEVAIKFEHRNCRVPQLAFEAQLYRKLPAGEGVTEMVWFGREKTFNVLVMELLGKSLADLFDACNKRFSLGTVAFIADQSLRRIENMHAHDIVHRDIKPNNFVMGKDSHSRNTVHLLDYGLAKIYRIHGNHIPFRDDKKLTGTARYASLNAHLGRELSRRDDLESLGFMLVYFYKGSLPWQGNHNAKTKQEMYSAIKRLKRQTTLEELCHNLPNAFLDYLSYCRNLSFDQVSA